MIYLDNAATTGVRREALEAMWPYLSTHFGNPSSPHQMGADAAAGLKAARQAVAGVLGGRATQVTFTSGNPKIVKVDEYGTITAVSEGNANISVTQTRRNRVN